MRISVLGTGYLGATHAVCLAEAGHDVVAVDRDVERVETLAAGRAPMREEGLDEALGAALAAGRLTVTTDLSAARDADVHFVCVGTEGDDGDIQVDALSDLLASLAPLLRRPCVVVGRSTVPIGTARRVRDHLRAVAPAGNDVAVAWNPEFLREGHALDDTRQPHRIVLGTHDEEGLALLEEAYAAWADRGVPLIRTDLETAELAKLAANAMLAVRISTANVLGELCESAGADIEALVDIVGGDPRIGRDYLQPGPGYGGSCLPKDLRGLTRGARDLGLGVASDFLAQTDRVNSWQRERTERLARELLDGDPTGRRVAVLGTAFKAGSDDLRDSPSLDVAQRLAEAGAEVVGYDPAAPPLPDGLVRTVASAEEACAGAELVLVLTDWPEFASLDPRRLGRQVARRRVVDGRRCLDRDRWRRAGWELWSLGVDDTAHAHGEVPA